MICIIPTDVLAVNNILFYLTAEWLIYRSNAVLPRLSWKKAIKRILLLNTIERSLQL